MTPARRCALCAPHKRQGGPPFATDSKNHHRSSHRQSSPSSPARSRYRVGRYNAPSRTHFSRGGKCGKHFFVVRIPMHYRQLRIFNRQTHGCRWPQLGKQSLFCRKIVLQRPTATTLCCGSFGLPVASYEVCLGCSLLNRRSRIGYEARMDWDKNWPLYVAAVVVPIVAAIGLWLVGVWFGG